MSPFDWRASLICDFNDAMDDSGLMFCGGESVCEMAIDTLWYAGVLGRTAAFASCFAISL